jgi:hypothetical protein
MTPEPSRAGLRGRLRSTAVLRVLFFGLPLAGLVVISWAVGLVAAPILTPANIWTLVCQ